MKTTTLSKSISIGFVALLFGFTIQAGRAASIAVPNFSFETPIVVSGSPTTGYENDQNAVPGWTVGGGSGNGSSYAGVVNGGSPAYTPLDGSQVAYAHAQSTSTSLTTAAPVAAIVANTTYTLSVYVGNRSDGIANNGLFTVSLTDNGQIVNPTSVSGSSITAGTFTQVTATYTPPATSVGHNLGIKLNYAGTDANVSQGAFDDVSLSTSAGTSAAGTTFTFNLPASYNTSAGVYDSTGKLIRTLWRKVFYTAGAHTQTWNGVDDHGNAVAAGTYTIKILYHNVQYVWDGVIANTSSSFNNNSARHGLIGIQGLAVNGANGYEARGGNEGQLAMYRFNTASANTLVAGMGQADNIYSLSWNFVATDGTKVYYACTSTNNTATMAATNPGIIVAYNVSDNSNYAFSAGSSFYNCPDWLVANYPVYKWPNGVRVGTQPSIQGIAVQNSGNYLAVSVGADNKVYLLDKNSGSVLSSFAVTNPKSLAFDPNGDLWVVTGTTAVRYTSLSATPTVATTISGFSNPLAVSVHPTNADIVLIADGGTKQQVKGYTHTGTVATGWSSALGTVGGNKLAGPAVTNTKFWFTGGNDLAGFGFLGEYTYISIGADGSFWLGDGGNNRTLHFSSAKAFIEQIAYLPDTLNCNIDANNSNRVFAGFLEYQVDYTKPLMPGDPYATGGNKSWKLVNNWAGGIVSPYIGFQNGPFDVVTMSNGHTYALVRDVNANSHPCAVVEMSPTGGLRFTGSVTGPVTNYFEMEADGSIRYAQISGGTVTWYSCPLTGFDASFNPQWGSPAVLASAPAGATDPAPEGNGDGYIRYPITASNVVVSFDNGTTDAGMHLGGVAVGASSWLWEAAPAGPLDFLGTYDLSAQYAGDVTMAQDRSIIYGYNGEFGPGTESNQFMHFYDDGLFVGEFGVFGGVENATAGNAGNDFSPQLVKVSGEKYMWHNDESQHGGIHRWHLLGESAIQEASATGTLNSTINIVIPAAGFPTNLAVLPGAAKAALSWSPVAGASDYKVKYSTTRGGPYTTLSSSVTATSYSKTGLTNGTSYYFTVSAVVGGVESPNSSEVKVLPFDTTLAVQTAGLLQGGNVPASPFYITSANPALGYPALPSVAFSDILGNLSLYSVGSQGYVVYDNGYDPVANAFTDTVNVVSPLAVTRGTGWGWSQWARDFFYIDGVGEYLNSGAAMMASTTSVGTINISTTDTNWHTLTVFCPIYGNTDVGSYGISLTPQGLSTPVASYPVSGYASSNMWFQFRFQGNVTLTESAQSGSYATLQAIFIDNLNIAVTPVAPAGLAATAGGHQVSLTWTTTPNATSYNIYRGTAANGESGTAIATNVVGNGYADVGLTTGTHYYYKIKAVNGVGTSPYSNEANATSL